MFGLTISFPGQTTKEQQSLISHPATHVRDHQPDENDNNRVEIEEHLLEVQEGPLADKNDDQMNMAE